MNIYSIHNYINKDDVLLGDLDRIRLELERQTQNMSFEQEQNYFSHWQKDLKVKMSQKRKK